MCPGDGAAGRSFVKSLGRNGYPPGLGDGELGSPNGHGADNTGPEAVLSGDATGPALVG